MSLPHVIRTRCVEMHTCSQLNLPMTSFLFPLGSSSARCIATSCHNGMNASLNQRRGYGNRIGSDAFYRQILLIVLLYNIILRSMYEVLRTKHSVDIPERCYV